MANEKLELVKQYQSKIDSINGANTLLIANIKVLDRQVDSLGKLKTIIYVEYEKKVDAINDASAADHAKWLDAIVLDLKDSTGLNK